MSKNTTVSPAVTPIIVGLTPLDPEAGETEIHVYFTCRLML